MPRITCLTTVSSLQADVQVPINLGAGSSGEVWVRFRFILSLNLHNIAYDVNKYYNLPVNVLGVRGQYYDRRTRFNYWYWSGWTGGSTWKIFESFGGVEHVYLEFPHPVNSHRYTWLTIPLCDFRSCNTPITQKMLEGGGAASAPAIKPRGAPNPWSGPWDWAETLQEHQDSLASHLHDDVDIVAGFHVLDGVDVSTLL